MIDETTFVMEMGMIFNDFLNGNAVLKINNPDELYQVYEMFHRSTIIFANTNLMEDVDLIAQAASVSLRSLDLSRDVVQDGMVPPPKGYRMKTRALYQYLRSGNFGFKGFPVYLLINDKWDDTDYSCDPTIIQTIGINPSHLRQVVFLYARNQEIFVLNPMNPLTFTKGVETGMTAFWEERPDEIEEGTQNEFHPIWLQNVITAKIRYKVCILANQAMYHISRLVDVYNDALLKMHHDSARLLDFAIESLTETDVIGQVSNPVDPEVREDFNQLLLGKGAFAFDDPNDYQNVAIVFDFTAHDQISMYTPPQVEPGERFYLWFDAWERSIVSDSEPENGLRIITYDQRHRGFFNKLAQRLMDLMNMDNRLLMSYPCFGGHIPPRFIWAIRDVISMESNARELPDDLK